MDEEWPCGRHALESARREGDVSIVRVPRGISAAEPPAVLGTFEGAEGWKPEGDVFVGDCMPYADGGRYHVLYLKDRRHHQSKWGLGAHQWEHISTDDLCHWQIHPMAVAIEAPEEGSICTGSWIRRGETHYLYYTIRTCDGSPARVARSVSGDGWHFRRDEAIIPCKSVPKAAVWRNRLIFTGFDGHGHYAGTMTFLKATTGEDGQLCYSLSP